MAEKKLLYATKGRGWSSAVQASELLSSKGCYLRARARAGRARGEKLHINYYHYYYYYTWLECCLSRLAGTVFASLYSVFLSISPVLFRYPVTKASLKVENCTHVAFISG